MNTDKTEAVPNYSVLQVSQLTAASPVDWEGAKALGLLMDKSPQSIVSKIKNLGLEYTPKPPPRKKAVQDTKIELVASIQKLIDRDLSGLEKASRQAILNLQNGVLHLVPAKVDSPLPEIGDSE